MCGILALFNIKQYENFFEDFEIALKALNHRGPDDEGRWFDKEENIFFGHKRLSILDLSQNGKQPMISHNGRWVITYNGEIYNWRSIQYSLECYGINFHTKTDTEVLLEAISYWGIESTLQKAVGMFAFVIWDRLQKRLFIARDRLGEKPLYYSSVGMGWIISSELKSIKPFKFFDRTKSILSINLFLRYNYIPSPYTIYKSTFKLNPGCYAELYKDGNICHYSYWNFLDVAIKQNKKKYSLDLNEAVDQLQNLIDNTIQIQQIADVPVGAFLSGGIDSSLIVARMQALNNKQIHTFSIGYVFDEYSETKYAKSTADYLGTLHSEFIITDKEAKDAIYSLNKIYDEPFADSSAIPTYFVSKYARDQVVVSLTGDGGDEIFGGYNRYHKLIELWHKLNIIPKNIRNNSGKMINIIELIFERLGFLNLALESNRISKYGKINTFEQLYDGMTSYFSLSNEYLTYDNRIDVERIFNNSFKSFEYAMAVDTITYLPDDILTKVDRASMANSLETRIPFLDHRLIEWAWSLPVDMKINEKQTKIILKKLLKKILPDYELNRQKMGFSIPLNHWLRNDLNDWADTLLSESSISKTQLFDYKKVYSLWNGFKDNKNNEKYIIWSILILQDWLIQNDY